MTFYLDTGVLASTFAVDANAGASRRFRASNPEIRVSLWAIVEVS